MRRRNVLTGLAVAPCVALVPSLVKGDDLEFRGKLFSALKVPGRFAASTVPQGRPFRRGYEFVRGDLALFTAGRPVESVTYTLVGPLSVPHGYGYVIGPRDRVPFNPAPGEYYPELQVPWLAEPGEYQIRWSVRLKNGEVWEPAQPFWVGSDFVMPDGV